MTCVSLEVEPPSVTLWETELWPELAYPDISGQAAAVSGSAGTELGIVIQGAEPDAVHAWGLRLGSCTAPGAQIGPDSDYPELEVGSTGSASVETLLGTQLNSEGAYHVEVRVGALDATRVACGDLVAR